MKVIFFLLVLLICSLPLLCSLLLIESMHHENNKDHDTLNNVYGEPLQPCRIYHNNNNRGSWDTEGYCSEMDRSVHQICVEVDNAPNFSLQTGQGDWSEDRAGRNHCMCLGAWALYKARQDSADPDIRTEETSDELKCESIPDTALSSRYINKWNRWNGYELDGQIINGITSIYTQCMDEAVTQSQQNNLQTKYNELRARIPELPEYP